MRHIGIVDSSRLKAVAPTVAISSTTNFNQDRATFNGTVSANGSITTIIKFQVSTDGGTNWSDATGGTAITNTSSQSVSVFYNATSLSIGTAYLVRLVATNAGGTSISTTTSFTTWSYQAYERSTVGGITFAIPTITPTGGSEITANIYDIIVFGAGGGGGGYVGGGGGGYQNIASRALVGARNVTTSVGAGGAAVDFGNATNATAGGASSISGDLTTVTAAGGGADTTGQSIAGSSGNGNAGGSNAQYDYTPGDEKGYLNTAHGGSGGAGGAGGNGVANSSGTYAGNGGEGVSITSGGVTRTGGAGAPGINSTLDGGPSYNGTTSPYNAYGSGGIAGTAGQPGFVRFRYFAASALA